MKKTIGLILAAAMLMMVLSSCGGGEETFNNLVITNTGSESVSSIAIQLDKETHVMGSPLAPNEKCSFDMDRVDGCRFRVDITAMDGRVFPGDELTMDFSLDKGHTVYLDLVKDAAGKWSVISEMGRER